MRIKPGDAALAFVFAPWLSARLGLGVGRVGFVVGAMEGCSVVGALVGALLTHGLCSSLTDVLSARLFPSLPKSPRTSSVRTWVTSPCLMSVGGLQLFNSA